VVYHIIVTRIHRALICSKIQVYDVVVEYNNEFLYSIWTPPFNLAPFKSLTNFKDFPRSLNGESGRASHLMYNFDKEIARCNNSQIKILNLFEFPHVLAAKAKVQMTY